MRGSKLTAKPKGWEARDRLKAIQGKRDESSEIWKPYPNSPQEQAIKSPANIIGFGGQAGGGKALALDTLIRHVDGWKTMADTHPGDFVFDESGMPCRVIAESVIFTDHDCYELEFDNGEKVIADADHRWATLTDKDRDRILRSNPEWMARRRAKRPSRSRGIRPDVAIGNAMVAAMRPPAKPPEPSIRTTAEIAATVKVRNGSRTNHSIRLSESLSIPYKELPIEPYVLGAWLGDGTAAHGSITCDHADDHTIEVIRLFGYIVTNNGNDIRWGILGLKKKLRDLGVLDNKHIPSIYLNSSYTQRLELLRGLMDTDGDCCDDGGAEFSNTNRSIAYGVLELARSLGIKATISEGRAMLYGQDCGPKWRVKITTNIQIFHLPRKANCQKETVRDTQRRHYIIACRKVDSVPVKCIAVDSPSRLYLCTESLIPTHNTDLLLGISATQHKSSIIFRREYTNLKGIIKRSRELFAAHGKYNANDHAWRGLPGGREVEFGAAQYEESVEKFRGVPHDGLFFDEATAFSESQIWFLMGWNRTTIPGQRCRVILTFNPPTNPDERWIIKFFAPWLDRKHPNPAMPGELRWFARINGEDVERPDGEPFEHVDAVGRTELITPLSRTFFPSRLVDNPILAATNYGATLQSLPEPLRSQVLYGDFDAGVEDAEWQVIPTDWVVAAMRRWAESEAEREAQLVSGHPGEALRSLRERYGPLTTIGADIARGGADSTSIAPRRRIFVDRLRKYTGKQTPDGRTAAQYIHQDWHDNALVNIDATGIGADAFTRAQDLGMPCQAINSSSGSRYTDKSGKYKMVNLRAEAYWRLRDILDPESEFPAIMLPDDPQLLADLTAPTYRVGASGIRIEPKEDIKARIKRSPDDGDAVAYSFLPPMDEPQSIASPKSNPINRRWGTTEDD